MIWLAAVAATCCVMLACWGACGWFAGAWARYRQVYTDEAGARLDEVFLFVDPRQLWGATLACCCAVAAGVYAAAGSGALAALAGLAPIRVPHALIAILRRRRQHRFDTQLPDMLLALGASLRAGASLAGALRQLVDHCQPPLAQEFGLILREQRLGVSFDQALLNLRVRMPTEATGLVVSALRIATQTGGNLAEALERIATMLADRLRLQGRVRALTAQGRLQAWIVGALTPALAGVLTWLDPASMAPLWHTPAGWAVLGIVVALEAAGVIWIRRIVNIDI
ncbi:type II secretion system F family protein [Bordetella bronchialis]|uniref:Pilus assembly protein n=1 Tax=Bordetella bronchialis TaxID=463025 RepID=A0A193FPF2_9BORD|nr:type II secretion system F family protein [Bordetella bronchialis]ANN69535.1 pilus assembly protein [Bordetella bronchialis]ANN74686.1 pilus assembly protein [Bordetella bronchialis]